MSPRTTGILLLVALGLGAFVHFYVIGGEEGRQAEEARGKRLFPEAEAADVAWLELTTSDGTAVRAERGEGGWRIVEPLDFPGDAFALDAVASAAAEVAGESTFEEPQALEVYGLGPGAPELRFGTAEEEYGLRTGKQTPIGGNTYAVVVGGQAVHTIAAFQANALSRSFDDLREKKILDFDADAVRRVVASWPDGRVELVREGETWKLVAPLEDRADADAVRDLLSDLSFLRATGFEDAPADAAALGLDRPAFAVELEIAASEAEAPPRRLTLAIGANEADGDRLVRGAGSSLYRVPSGRLEDFDREVSAYRFKELARFGAADATRVELRFRDPAGGSVEILAERGEAGWSSTPEAVEPEKLARLVDELSRLDASEVLAERVGPEERVRLELDPANAAFVVSGEGEGEAARLAEVRLGAIRPGAGVVAQTGEDPRVYELAMALGEFLPLNLEGFRNHFLAAPEAAEEAPMSEGEPALDLDPLGDPAAMPPALER